MNPAELLGRLESAGVRVFCRDSQLVLTPACGVPPQLIPAIKAAKPDLLRIISAALVPGEISNSTGMRGFTAPDLDETDRAVLRWLDITRGRVIQT